MHIHLLLFFINLKSKFNNHLLKKQHHHYTYTIFHLIYVYKQIHNVHIIKNHDVMQQHINYI